MDATVVARIRELAANTDAEACGALVGTSDTIVDAWPLTNQSTSARDSFFISAAEVLRVELAAEARGLHVVGFYHSHPRGAAVPSHADLIQAVPGYIHLIVAKNGEMRAWRLRADRSGFDQVRA